MGRLIDADNISFYCNYKGDCTGNINDCKKCENYICNFRDVQEQPTAYDVEKVVEELECDRCESCSFIEVCGGTKYCGICHEKIIEIVKQGDIRKDVSE